MARYNTSFPVTTTSGSITYTTPDQGLFTTLTGTAPYTVTLPTPALFAGAHQTFYNSTSGTVTLNTPAGVIRNPAVTASANWSLVAGAAVSLASNGTDYIAYVNTGGPLTATTAAFSGNTSVTGSSTFTVGTGASNLGGSLTVSGTATFNGSTVTASSSFTPSADYHLMTKIFTERTYGKPWVTRNSSVTLAAGDRVFADTSSTAITLTLPASPATGDQVWFIDLAGTFNVRALTVGNNGQRIMRQLDTMTVTTAGAAFSLVYSNSSYGWLLESGI
jgi:hypothetical protein